MTIGSSILLIAIGAILKYAVTAHVSGINIQTAGTVLLILGIVGLVLSVIYTFYWSRSRTSEVRVHDDRDPRYNDPRY
jgi:beta-lactamase regulating signal transducer with metallopeptidase domain